MYSVLGPSFGTGECHSRARSVTRSRHRSARLGVGGTRYLLGYEWKGRGQDIISSKKQAELVQTVNITGDTLDLAAVQRTVIRRHGRETQIRTKTRLLSGSDARVGPGAAVAR